MRTGFALGFIGFKGVLVVFLFSLHRSDHLSEMKSGNATTKSSNCVTNFQKKLSRSAISAAHAHSDCTCWSALLHVGFLGQWMGSRHPALRLAQIHPVNAYSFCFQWKKKRDEEREKERQRRDAERKAREAKRAAIMEERRLRDEERARQQRELSRLKKLNPHEDEIASCDVLIAYLDQDTKTQEKKRCVPGWATLCVLHSTPNPRSECAHYLRGYFVVRLRFFMQCAHRRILPRAACHVLGPHAVCPSGDV